MSTPMAGEPRRQSVEAGNQLLQEMEQGRLGSSLGKGEEGWKLAKIYFTTINRVTVALTLSSLVAAIFVLFNIFSFYDTAYDEVGATIVESVTSQVQSGVSKFFVPKFNIRSVFQFAISAGVMNTQDVWTKATGSSISLGMTQYANLMGPLFYSEPNFLAAYSAMDNQQVLKYSSEKPEYWKTEHRHYVNETYQERLGCQNLKVDWKNPTQCTIVPTTVKSYNPFEKGWYKTAMTLNGDCHKEYKGGCDDAFAWEGPDFQTATSDGDTDRPVFNMLFKLNWPDMAYAGVAGTTNHSAGFKVKFLIEELKAVLDSVNVGANGDLAIVNEKGQILAAKSVATKDLVLLDEDGEKSFKTLNLMPKFSMVGSDALGQDVQVTVEGEGLGRDKFVVTNPIKEVAGWTVVMYVEIDNFLLESTALVQVAGSLSMLSISLTAIRTALFLFTWAGQWYVAKTTKRLRQVAPAKQAAPAPSAYKQAAVTEPPLINP